MPSIFGGIRSRQDSQVRLEEEILKSLEKSETNVKYSVNTRAAEVVEAATFISGELPEVWRVRTNVTCLLGHVTPNLVKKSSLNPNYQNQV